MSHEFPSAAARHDDRHELGVAAAARAIRNGEITSEALAAQLLDRARLHADLQAFITIDDAAVLAAARQADRALRAGAAGPLLGVPLAVKDSYFTEGSPRRSAPPCCPGSSRRATPKRFPF